MVGVMTVVLMLSLGSMCIAGYLVSAHRARAAADLAALSAAAAFVAGADGCTDAKQVAVANRARLVSCVRVGDAIEFVFTVRVEVLVKLRTAGLPDEVAAEAHAGSLAQ